MQVEPAPLGAGVGGVGWGGLCRVPCLRSTEFAIAPNAFRCSSAGGYPRGTITCEHIAAFVLFLAPLLNPRSDKTPFDKTTIVQPSDEPAFYGVRIVVCAH